MRWVLKINRVQILLVIIYVVFIYIYCRILELKNEMVFLEYLEYYYFDDVLLDFKFILVSNIIYFMYNKIYYLF